MMIFNVFHVASNEVFNEAEFACAKKHVGLRPKT